MRGRFVRVITIGVVLAMVVATAAAAAPARPAPPGPSEHASVVAYWTTERVRDAVPRDFILDRVPEGMIPLAKGGGKGKPGGGGGDGGGGGGKNKVPCGDTNGSSWSCGGEVVETTGKVLFTLGTTNYVCSGSVVADGVSGRSTVLTAGHCVYDEGSDRFATNWMFVPEYEVAPTFTCSETRWGCWTAESLVTTSAWAGGDFSHDYAFAVMRPGGHDGTTDLEDTIGAQAIAFDQPHPASVYAFGYPQAKPYKGDDLIYCAGDDAPDVYGSGDYGLGCKMTGGSSGGPWFVGFDTTGGTGTLTSVNSFKYSIDSGTMYGPYLGDYAARTFAAAITASADLLVAP